MKLLQAGPQHYQNNPLVHENRRRAQASSAWVQSFGCEDMGVLVVCRGPVRKEALDVFKEMGIENYGILLSEKDSIVYTDALAPELRELSPRQVHRIPDYSGASKEEREARIAQIIQIAKNHSYQYVFAGYGFMAEDEYFVSRIEGAGLSFMGPCSATVRAAGRKDEAKRTALREGVSTTPGVDNLTARTLLGKYAHREDLRTVAAQNSLKMPEDSFNDEKLPLEVLADRVLEAGYKKGIDLVNTEELCLQLKKEVLALYQAHPGRRIRLKAIGGGGGKGQRILTAPTDAKEAEKAAEKAPELFREILSEVKATGVGDNKNVLLELNIEKTRHHEIQLLGNGEWCISMGGRDCSLQMHEQKLLEISITQEGLSNAINRAHKAGNDVEAKALQEDFETLAKMEAEGACFGTAVGLDSASTFECIVEGPNHYFMEVNTRIQVEHRVTELCYKLRFTNPEDENDFLEVNSLVEAMALLAKHKARLPKPTRHLRKQSALEARLNATDASLSPHAGGVIEYWSSPIAGEVRDDQGICIRNPDTGRFVRYKVAGAYDSNIALLVSVGEHREHSMRHLAEVLRVTKLVGRDLATNLEFHYGLVNWFLARNVYAKPTTRFVVPYLTQVGLLKEQANSFDIDGALKLIADNYLKQAEDKDSKESVAAIAARKLTLLRRPVRLLLEEPHIFSGWLSAHLNSFVCEGEQVRWLDNPVRVLSDTYHTLNMDYRRELPAAQVIWDHDADILREALHFYDALESQFGGLDYVELDSLLRNESAPKGYGGPDWQTVRASHLGFQQGLEIFDLLILLAEKAGFFEMRVEENLEVFIPERLLNTQLQNRMKKVLVPPPVMKADEVVAVSGGMFYSREAPDRPPMVEVGSEFEKGDPLYIVEVMKMFNKIAAPFAGTIDKILVEGGDGTIVRKGQPLFKVTPKEIVEPEDPEIVRARQAAYTGDLVSRVFSGKR